MATVAETLELAIRVEQASGPDRVLDNAAFRVIGAPVPFQFANQMIALSFDETEQCYLVPVGDMRFRYEPPAYTASLDAAMGLVPEEATFGIARRVAGEGAHADIDLEFFGDAATPALALCAAALRAAAAKAREL